MQPKHTIDECREFAKRKGGNCNSSYYVNNKTDLEWECDKRHTWDATYKNVVINGSWCRICWQESLRYTIEDCKQIAISKGGQCLSDVYIGIGHLLRWTCRKGHEWSASLDVIKNQDSWCQECYIGPLKYTIEDCKEYAKSKGGFCLDDVYFNKRFNMIWQCEKLHTPWKANWNSIKSGHWCPSCRSRTSKEQENLHFTLSSIYNFPVILNDTNTIRPLDLDIYIPCLKIAFEYDGDYWHYSDWAINERHSLEKMARKDMVCKNIGIKLIRINECDWMDNKELKLTEICDFIDSQLSL